MAIFSIIIPYYHTYQWNLNKLLTSIAIQSIPQEHLEVIFVGEWDDKEPKDIFKKYDKNLDIKWLQKNHDKQHTPGVSRQMGLGYCSGDWITFIDADDYLKPGYFRHCLRLINANNNTPFIIISNDRIIATVHGVLFQKKWLKKNSITFYPIDFYCYEDTFFLNRCIACTNKNDERYIRIKKDYYVYYENWKSILHTLPQKIERKIYIGLKSHMLPFIEFYCERNKLIVKRIFILFYFYYLHCLKMNLKSQKMNFINRQFKTNIKAAKKIYNLSNEELIAFYKNYHPIDEYQYIDTIFYHQKIEISISFKQFLELF